MNPLEPFRVEIKRQIEARGIAKINVEEPPEGLGDFCVKCFSFAKEQGKSAEELAIELAGLFTTTLFEKVEAKGGYLNFYVDKRELARNVLEAVLKERERYGWANKKGRIIVEHTSANPTGPLHVGRGRNPIIGDTLSRILRALGYTVETEYYVDDMGRQLAILAWATKKFGLHSIKPTREKVDHMLGEIYRKGNELFERDEEVRREIEELIRAIESGNREVIEYQRKIGSRSIFERKNCKRNFRRIRKKRRNY